MLSNEKLNDLARMFKALSHPHRLAIFLKLANCCSKATGRFVPEDASVAVGDLGEGLNISPSTLSHHIKELRDSGLIKVETAGQARLCCVDLKTLTRLSSFLQNTAQK